MVHTFHLISGRSHIYHRDSWLTISAPPHLEVLRRHVNGLKQMDFASHDICFMYALIFNLWFHLLDHLNVCLCLLQGKAGSTSPQISQECVADTEADLEQSHFLLTRVSEKCHFCVRMFGRYVL